MPTAADERPPATAVPVANLPGQTPQTTHKLVAQLLPSPAFRYSVSQPISVRSPRDVAI